jgi:hypothetical protein
LTQLARRFLSLNGKIEGRMSEGATSNVVMLSAWSTRSFPSANPPPISAKAKPDLAAALAGLRQAGVPEKRARSAF